jgi:rhodanese-related sulfurtransferase
MYLDYQGFSNVINLAGGVDAWAVTAQTSPFFTFA